MSDRRCQVTRNPCGTDTWPAEPGCGCKCGECVAYRDEAIDMLHRRLARAEELLSKARNQMDNPNPLSTLDERIDAFLSGASDD